MIIIGGQGFHGKVDAVPGLFYVTTDFVSFFFVPMIPEQSWLILEGTERQVEGHPQPLVGEFSASEVQFQGVKIPLSLKSVAVTWWRSLWVLVGVFSTLISLLLLHSSTREGRENDQRSGLLGLLLAVVAFVLVGVSRRFFSRASRSRALALGELAGIPAEVVSKHLDGSTRVEPDPSGQ